MERRVETVCAIAGREKKHFNWNDKKSFKNNWFSSCRRHIFKQWKKLVTKTNCMNSIAQHIFCCYYCLCSNRISQYWFMLHGEMDVLRCAVSSFSVCSCVGVCDAILTRRLLQREIEREKQWEGDEESNREWKRVCRTFSMPNQSIATMWLWAHTAHMRACCTILCRVTTVKLIKRDFPRIECVWHLHWNWNWIDCSDCCRVNYVMILIVYVVRCFCLCYFDVSVSEKNQLNLQFQSILIGHRNKM